MLYLKTHNISYNYPGAEELLQDIGVQIDSSTKCGFIGDNGTGKSTLFQLFLKNLKPASGTINHAENLSIGYLAQENAFDIGTTVEEQLWKIRPKLVKLRQLLNNPASKTENILKVCTDYEQLGGYEFETSIEQILEEFNLKSLCSQSAISLSGGEKTRLSLACIIIKQPDMLLLDEPTNHLDLQALEWLENYLKNCKIPFVVISHDRIFLDRCVNRIWAIENNSLREYSGNYSFYCEEKRLEYKRQILAYEVQQKKIHQLISISKRRRTAADKTENFKLSRSKKKNGGKCKRDDGSGSCRHNTKKEMKSAKALEKRIERLKESKEAKKPENKKKHKVKFTSGIDCKGRYALRLETLSKGFKYNLFEELNLVLPRGERLSITGANGSGKTTLLRLIAGLDSPDNGKVLLPESTSISYFAQEYENLNLNKSILEEILDGNYRKQANARTLLGCLGIRKDMVFRRIKSLSLGERSKVSLAKTMLSGANLLLLDEPTNHLEIVAREVIEKALLEYEGTIIFVSHDRMFTEKIATENYSL